MLYNSSVEYSCQKETILRRLTSSIYSQKKLASKSLEITFKSCFGTIFFLPQKIFLLYWSIHQKQNNRLCTKQTSQRKIDHQDQNGQKHERHQESENNQRQTTIFCDHFSLCFFACFCSHFCCLFSIETRIVVETPS